MFSPEQIFINQSSHRNLCRYNSHIKVYNDLFVAKPFQTLIKYTTERVSTIKCTKQNHAFHSMPNYVNHLKYCKILKYCKRLQMNHLWKSQKTKTCSKMELNTDRAQIGTYLFKTCFPVTANPTAIPPIAPATAADLGPAAAL